MKQSKWFKWQVGMVASVIAAFLFHEVKASSAFEQATTAAKNSTTDPKISANAGSEDYMDRWASQAMSGSSDTPGSSSLTNPSTKNNQNDLSGNTERRSSHNSDTFSRSKTGRS
ncbi:hypothetical protein GCM10023310_30760 [Paenibacillus vulneris]|uniref:Uncharacterized protein n=1 Tax=Paenibacillus vulneris TaxID=1133364 RepID=A0ABW3UP92_9BACL